MNEFENLIRTGSKPKVDAERLRVMGKQAAARFISDNVELNDSIAEMSKEASLNEEQVKRVVEYANNYTFNARFNSGYDTNVEFPVADASTIITPVIKQASVTLSSLSPQIRYVPGQEYTSVLDAFASETDHETEKTASTEWTAQDSRDFAAAMDELRHELSDYAIIKSEFELMVDNVKTAMTDSLREGAKPAEVLQLVKSAGILPQVMELLIEGEDTVYKGRNIDLAWLEPEVNHPLFKTASALSVLTSEALGNHARIVTKISSANEKFRPNLQKLAAGVL